MTTNLSPAADRAVRTYLDDLGRMLDGSPSTDRLEVLADVREHIEAALAQEADNQEGVELDENAVHTVLGRIGAPAGIAADAMVGVDRSVVVAPAPAAEPFLSRPWLPWLIVGLMALSVIPFLGWLAALVGLVLFWKSPLWGRTAKIVGTGAYLMPLVFAGLFLLPVVTAQAAPQNEIGSFVPASYDVLWTLVVGVPLWLVPVSVVLALIARRQQRA